LSRRKRAHRAWCTHPLTGAQFRVTADTAPQLAHLVGTVTALRDQLRIGMVSPEDVDRKLRRLQHGAVTVERAARSYMASPIAENTRRKCASWLAGPGAPLAAVELYALDGPQCERWIGSPAMRRNAPESVKTYWRVLRAVVQHATVRGWLAQVPWGGWKPRIRAAGYAPGREDRESARDVGELLALFAAARQLDAKRPAAGKLPDVEAKCVAVALLGVRQGELARLRWCDLNASAGTVRVQSTKQGGPPVELRADPVLFERLEQLRGSLQIRNLYFARGPVFPAGDSTFGKPRHYGPRAECLPRTVIREAAALAKLPHPDRWSAQSLRDTFATLESEGHAGDLEATRERTRHASIVSLVRYLRSLGRAPAAPGFTLPAAPTVRALP